MINRNWKPNTKVGPFTFGQPLSNYLLEYNLTPDAEDCQGGSWIQYCVPDTELFLSFEDEQLISIMIFDEILYEEKNLIGLSINVLKKLLNTNDCVEAESVEYENGDIQTCYELDSLGLQVWVKKDLVVSVNCCDLTD